MLPVLDHNIIWQTTCVHEMIHVHRKWYRPCLIFCFVIDIDESRLTFCVDLWCPFLFINKVVYMFLLYIYCYLGALAFGILIGLQFIYSGQHLQKYLKSLRYEPWCFSYFSLNDLSTKILCSICILSETSYTV